MVIKTIFLAFFIVFQNFSRIYFLVLLIFSKFAVRNERKGCKIASSKGLTIDKSTY